MTAVTMPSGISTGFSTTRREEVGVGDERRAEDGRHRDDAAVVVADEETRDVRHYQPDERHHAGDADGGAGEQGRRRDGEQPGALDTEPE